MASIASKTAKAHDTSAGIRDQDTRVPIDEEVIHKLSAKILGLLDDVKDDPKLDKLFAEIGEKLLRLRLAEEIERAQLQAYDAQLPHFETQEELDAWWDKQPKVKAEVDPRLGERVKTSVRLNRLVIDGYNYLARQMGFRSGQTLMKIVLDNYLAKSLPPDF